MKRALFVIFSTLFLLSACLLAQASTSEVIQEKILLPPLDSGTIFLQSSGVPLIYLTGEKALADSLFRRATTSTRIYITNSILTLIHHNWAQMCECDYECKYDYECDYECECAEIRHYSFPDMQFITSAHIPNWTNSATMISTVDSTSLFYLLRFEPSLLNEYRTRVIEWKQQMYKYDLSGKLTLLDYSLVLPITANEAGNRIATSITHIGDNVFIYQHHSAIVRTSITEKGTFIDTLFNIPQFPYRGELLLNLAKNRIVFAHRNHHLFHIIDLETNAVKTVDFKNGVHYYSREHEYCMGCRNPNPFYYVDSFAGENYFYLLFWGHTFQAFRDHARRGWREVGERWSREFEKTNEYEQNIPNIVEKYDWNGNLVARYLLKGNSTMVRPGHRDFWVDEQNRQFFIMTVDFQELWEFTSYQSALMVYSFCQD